MTIEEIKSALKKASGDMWTQHYCRDPSDPIAYLIAEKRVGDMIVYDKQIMQYNREDPDAAFLASAHSFVIFLLAKVERLQEEKICVWRLDEFHNFYETSCGQKSQEICWLQSPSAFSFCPDCGGKIVGEK